MTRRLTCERWPRQIWKGLNDYCGTCFRVVELTGDVTPDMRAVAQADLERVK